jgi:tetratricopeptide (TPR) repeat protein
MNGRADQATAEEQLAGAIATPVTAHDLFLDGESIRLQGASRVVADMRDRPALKQYNESLELALHSYQGALKLDPTHYWSRLQVGRCYLGLNRDAEAVEALSACIALRPDVPWGYSARGLALTMLRRFDEAAADFDRAIALDGECIPARLNRSVMYMLQERPTDAAAELQALMARPEPPPEALYYRGELFFFGGDSALALKCMNDLIQQRPQFAPAYLLRAKAHFEQGQSSDAMRDIDAFMAATATTAVDLSDAAARRGHLIRYIASQLTGPGRNPAVDAGVAELKTAAKSEHASAATFADLGAVLQMQSQVNEAATAYARAIELASNEPQYRVDRGWLLDGLDRISDAQADFAEALRIDPTHSEAMTGLGYTEARQGRCDDAERHASLALLNGGSDYLILHNVACIYAMISRGESTRRTEHEDVALAMLRRALELSRREHDFQREIQLIQREPAFAVSLRQRPEFKNLASNLSS